jgi:hypothetical protein
MYGLLASIVSVKVRSWHPSFRKRNMLYLLIVCKESGLDVNAVKTKYIFMSREEDVGNITT